MKRPGFRRGDNAQIARVEFVDDLKAAPVAKAAETEEAKKPKPLLNRSAKKPAPKKAKETKEAK